VFCTVSSAARLQRYAVESKRFGAVVVDEAAQATEPAALVPLHVANTDLCVLVGDDRQLPPTVFSSNGLTSVALFERLRQLGHPAELLEEQYRMAPEISAFPSMYFYGERLKDSVNMQSSTRRAIHQWLPPLLFLNLHSSQAQKSGSSWRNPEEARLCASLLVWIKQTAIAVEEEQLTDDVGVITPYRGQQAALRRELATQRWPDNMVNTVDGYQGRECEVIILDTVRAQQDANRGGVGFLADERRLNVALTRAKSILVIIGHAPTLERSKAWAALLDHVRERDCLLNVPSPEDLWSVLPAPSTASSSPRYQAPVAPVAPGTLSASEAHEADVSLDNNVGAGDEAAYKDFWCPEEAGPESAASASTGGLQNVCPPGSLSTTSISASVAVTRSTHHPSSMSVTRASASASVAVTRSTYRPSTTRASHASASVAVANRMAKQHSLVPAAAVKRPTWEAIVHVDSDNDDDDDGEQSEMSEVDNQEEEQVNQGLTESDLSAVKAAQEAVKKLRLDHMERRSYQKSQPSKGAAADLPVRTTTTGDSTARPAARKASVEKEVMELEQPVEELPDEETRKEEDDLIVVQDEETQEEEEAIELSEEFKEEEEAEEEEVPDEETQRELPDEELPDEETHKEATDLLELQDEETLEEGVATELQDEELKEEEEEEVKEEEGVEEEEEEEGDEEEEDWQPLVDPEEEPDYMPAETDPYLADS